MYISYIGTYYLTREDSYNSIAVSTVDVLGNWHRIKNIKYKPEP